MKKKSLIFLFLAIISGVATLFVFQFLQSDPDAPMLMSENESKPTEAVEGETPVSEPTSTPTPTPT
ncbi:MAG TPA: hypothetical protein DCY30_02385, partial [Acidimicrobiaceae bacterium]|nr:hypothetical protein [Acidimicrobiaceae bacterium]